MSDPEQPAGSDDPKTVFAPFNPGASVVPVVPPAQAPAQPTAAAAPSPAAPSPAAPAPAAPASEQPAGMLAAGDGRIQTGDVLNHIYEVRRFIARGGMGEVYEGVNVNNPDERVAIKVILPALAADPNVQAMFRKEATTLTRLSHPALVTYRLLAQEPRLGVLYIVTEYIDGTNLSDVLATVPRDAASLAGLMRRLADGLRVAHELGAVHRDISPDNVILEDGELTKARIIDFGIAKDLDPGKATIIGDGFAGKLAYVAPEQLGYFDREMGPWTDIYSLALVILAVASGKNVDMGATLFDAVEKRRAGVDVSIAPEPLRPILMAMLQPNPKDRLRSMADVLAALDNPALLQAPSRPDAPAKGDKPGAASRLLTFVKARPALVGGGALTAAALAATAVFLSGDGSEPAPTTTEAAAVAETPDATARKAMLGVLPSLPCSWLDLENLSVADGAVTASFRGVAGYTARTQTAITNALVAGGLTVASINFENVSPAPTSVCALLDAYRPIKSARGGDISSDQQKYEKALQSEGNLQGQVAAVPQIHISADAMRGQLVLGGIDPDGSAGVFVNSTAELRAFLENPENGGMNPDGSATLKATQTVDGLVGVLVVYSANAIDPALIAPPTTARGEDWHGKFLSTARQNGWQADMTWFKIVNEVPDTPPPG